MGNIRELAQTFIDALHALEQGEESDIDGLVRLYSEDAHLTNAALQLAGKERTGHDGVREFWREYRHTFPEIYSDFAHITVDDRTVGLFWTARGTNSNGEPLEYDGVTLLVFDEDGNIARFRGYYDTRSVERTMPAQQSNTTT